MVHISYMVICFMSSFSHLSKNKIMEKAILNPIDEIIFHVIMYKNNHITYEDLNQAIVEIFEHYNIENRKN